MELKIAPATTLVSTITAHIYNSFKQSQNAKTLVLLSGGSYTQVYENLVKMLKAKPLDLTGFDFALADERFTPPTSSDSNEYSIRETGFVSLATELGARFTTIYIEGATPDEISITKSSQYSNLLKHSQTKIALLGIGEDCHTAGIFPLSATSFNEIYVRPTLPIVSIDLESFGSPNKHPKRISVTPDVISMQSEIIVFAKGEQKTNSLKAIHSGKLPIHKCPASIMSTHRNATIYTDCKV